MTWTAFALMSYEVRLLALFKWIFENTDKCPFGYTYNRKKCPLGYPGCACADEIISMEVLGIIGEES